jgi:hypothetical protein
MKKSFQYCNYQQASPGKASVKLVVLFLINSLYVFAQTDTVFVQSDILPGEGNLNTAVKTVTDAGKLSNTVFMLEPFGYYVLIDSILVPAGEHLTIAAPEPGLAQETAPPQILCSSKYDGWTKNLNYLFVCEGDLTLKNIWLLYATTSGRQIQACIVFQDNPNNLQKHKCDFDGVLIDYSSIPSLGGGSVTVACKNFTATFTNCYWKNCTDAHFRYYGRAVSFPFNTKGYHIDSLSFENCTFANIGYVLMQESDEYADYVKFNHCTFLNVVMYSLESGWWYNLSLTNSIFVNAFMYGYIPILEGAQPNGATIRIDSISTFDFEVPFKEQDRRILFSNSSYFIEKWLSNWMSNNPYSKQMIKYHSEDQIPLPQPMLNQSTINFFDAEENGEKIFPFMNKKDLYDSTDPGFILPPTDTNQIKSFLYHKWNDGVDTLWAWKSQNSLNRLWPLEENLAFTNTKLLKAGMGGFPLGDLFHWFPEKYSEWEAQKELENKRITCWLDNGIDTVFTNISTQSADKILSGFALNQNYPNPFNPTTNISFSVLAQGYVSLKVYNLLGKEVAVLFEGIKQVGNYTVTFVANQFPSGVYFCRMKANNFISTKKLILIK